MFAIRMETDTYVKIETSLTRQNLMTMLTKIRLSIKLSEPNWDEPSESLNFMSA